MRKINVRNEYNILKHNKTNAISTKKDDKILVN